MSASYETLDWSVDDGVLTLTLDRPDQLNAFTVTMAEELVAAFERASADDDVIRCDECSRILVRTSESGL